MKDTWILSLHSALIRCRYHIYGSEDVRQCLAGSHTLFIGDSTAKETVADLVMMLLGLGPSMPSVRIPPLNKIKHWDVQRHITLRIGSHYTIWVNGCKSTLPLLWHVCHSGCIYGSWFGRVPLSSVLRVPLSVFLPGPQLCNCAMLCTAPPPSIMCPSRAIRGDN